MPDENGEVYVPDAYISPDEAVMAYQTKQLTLQDEIYVRKEAIVDGEKITGLIKTTVGRIIFNDAIPQDLGFVERNKPEDYLKLEINYLVGKKDLSKIVAACFKKGGAACAAEVLDKIKALGFKYSTRGGITVGYKDVKVPEAKKQLIAEAEAKVDAIEAEYSAGFLSAKNRKKH